MLGDKSTTQKPFGKTTKKSVNSTVLAANNVSSMGMGLGKQSGSHIATLPDQPREIKKKITLVKRNEKENSLSTSERGNSLTPKSNSLKKLTVVSGKNFTSKRQSDYGVHQ